MIGLQEKISGEKQRVEGKEEVDRKAADRDSKPWEKKLPHPATGDEQAKHFKGGNISKSPKDDTKVDTDISGIIPHGKLSRPPSPLPIKQRNPCQTDLLFVCFCWI